VTGARAGAQCRKLPGSHQIDTDTKLTGWAVATEIDTGTRRSSSPAAAQEVSQTYRFMSPRVSVLMPVFNGEPYLGAAIESVQAQVFRDFEFIIVDDGSTDRSAETIARSARARQPIGQQLRFGREYASEVLYRAYTSALVGWRPVRATWCLAAAAALRPWKALRRVWRQVAARFASAPG
jgi:hypothetical protein